MDLRSFARVMAFASLAISGCATSTVGGRLYSLDQATRSPLTLTFSGSRNGTALASLPSGEQVSGEFVIWATRKGVVDQEAWGQIKALDRTKTEWPVVYGFGSESEVNPVGSAMLIGDGGASLEIIFYHAELEYSLVGDGLGRDNLGNWYRVMLGSLE